MKKELLTYKDPKSPVSEIFRTLRTNIQFMNTSRKMKTLLVTSTFPKEGKSWTTANLAITFAQAGKKVILIDADMRKGRQYQIFNVLPKPGLSNYLSNMDADNIETSNVNIVNYIQETDIENLHILVAGNVPPNPSELLVSTRMRELLDELKEMCDLIIIDGTPCDLVTDSIILSRFVDSTIILVAQKETKKDNLSRIVKNIKNVGGRIAGIVVNKVDISSRRYNESYYYGSICSCNIIKKIQNSKEKDETPTNLFEKNEKELNIKIEKYNEPNKNEVKEIEKTASVEEIESVPITEPQVFDIEKFIAENNIKLDLDTKNTEENNDTIQEEPLHKVESNNTVVEEDILNKNDETINENIKENINKDIDENINVGINENINENNNENINENIVQNSVQEESVIPEVEQNTETNTDNFNDLNDIIRASEAENYNKYYSYNNQNQNKNQYEYRSKKKKEKYKIFQYKRNRNDFNKNKLESNNASNMFEIAESAKGMPQDKANEIINLVNKYIEAEKQKQEQERKN